MPFLPEKELLIAVEAITLHGNQVAAAHALNWTRGKLQHRLREATRRGLTLKMSPAKPGMEISRITTTPNGGQFIQERPERGPEFEVPNGHLVKGVSALVDADGRTIQRWIKTREGQLDPLQLAEHIAATFAKFKSPSRPTNTPSNASDNLLTVNPLNDWHLNMLAWGKEVDGQNWDLKIAEDVLGNGAEDVISRSPASAICVLLGGGDLLHADTKRNETANGTRQDTDGRYQKGVEVLCRLLIRTTDAALRRHKHVIVRILPGNHDEHSSVAITYFLAAWYRNEPRVNVDVDPSLFFWHRFGSVLIGSTHGHTVPISKMPGIMAHRRAQDWGRDQISICARVPPAP